MIETKIGTRIGTKIKEDKDRDKDSRGNAFIDGQKIGKVHLVSRG
jgi:hypothetical protein